MRNKRLKKDEKYGTSMYAETELLSIAIREEPKVFDNDNSTPYFTCVVATGTDANGQALKNFATLPIGVMQNLGIVSNEQLPVEVTVSCRPGDNGPLITVLSSDINAADNSIFGDLISEVDAAKPRSVVVEE